MCVSVAFSPLFLQKGVAAVVHVQVQNLDISEGTIAPEATDAVAVGLYVNSELQEFTSEGFVSEWTCFGLVES